MLRRGQTFSTALATASAAALLLGGCGGGVEEDFEPPVEEGTVTVTEPPPVTLEGPVNRHGTIALTGDETRIEADDFYFEPTFITAEEGKVVTVQVRNEGNVDHTFTIDARRIDRILEQGETVEVTFDLPDSGTLVFVCRFHLEQGMQGAFVVQ